MYNTYREYPHEGEDTLALGLVTRLLDELELLLDILVKHSDQLGSQLREQSDQERLVRLGKLLLCPFNRNQHSHALTIDNQLKREKRRVSADISKYTKDAQKKQFESYTSIIEATYTLSFL